ncbi:MAG: flagellar hook-length control protein FliK [Candidatus Hydrogenedentes bacterium]|nr:flagellar hook-length control protein FliK [Candidatus Hydrogenedentota bacterium]
MNVSVIPSVASDTDAPEIPARRSSAKPRTDDASPFASLFTQAQSTSARQKASTRADAKSDVEGVQEVTSKKELAPAAASARRNDGAEKTEASPVDEQKGSLEQTSAAGSARDVNARSEVAKTASGQAAAVTDSDDAASATGDLAKAAPMRTELGAQQSALKIDTAVTPEVSVAAAEVVRAAGADSELDAAMPAKLAAVLDSVKEALSATPDKAATLESELLSGLRAKEVSVNSQTASVANTQPVKEAKGAPVVVVEAQVAAEGSSSPQNSTALYVSSPELSEVTAKADPASSESTVAAPPAKVSVSSTAKYVSDAKDSAEVVDLPTDEVVGETAKTAASGAKDQVQDVGASSDKAVKFGEIIITPLSKPESAPEPKADSAKSPEARPSASPLASIGAEKAITAKAASHASLIAAERPTLETIRDFTVKSVRYMVANGEKTISVRLVPESLGELRLEVTSNDNSVTVRMASANPAVREALQGQIHGLREALSRDGITVAQATVSAQMSSDHASKGFAGRQTPYFSQGVTPPWRSGDLPGAGTERWISEQPKVRAHAGVLNLFV